MATRKINHPKPTIRIRINDVRQHGYQIEERKLFFHVLMILISTGLTILGTLIIFQLWHIGMVIPALPNIAQEIWDWVFKQ